ncbi:MAG: DUF2959 domain-containing protein [Granulosicoccus sp.]|nr:DUF2959 domain-containing protein [Granulosicoccus sp.]
MTYRAVYLPTRLLNPVFMLIFSVLLATGCSTVKYNTLEKLGIHKRDLLVDNVEETRDAQKDAQKQFKSALEKFGSVVSIEETGLKKAYEALDDEYEDSLDAAEEVSDQIRDVENVAEDLFDEWANEIKEYTDPNLRRSSETQFKETRAKYNEMHKSMIAAEKSMQPVLATFKDNVLFLKHNLNAQAVGSLKSTFNDLQGDIDNLIAQMNRSIERSNQFISEMQPS